MTSIPEIHSDSFRMTDMKIAIGFRGETSNDFSTCCSEMFFREFWSDLSISARFMKISQPSFRKHCRENALSGVICCILSNRLGMFRFCFFLLSVRSLEGDYLLDRSIVPFVLWTKELFEFLVDYFCS
jgi:hypothetical protein